MRIYLWAERVSIRGSRDKVEFIGKAMAADGGMLAQHIYSSVEWAQKGLGYGDGNEVNRATYQEAYPTAYELVWLDDPLHDGGWWRAVFHSRRRYIITFVHAVDNDPAYAEFRDERTGRAIGHVVELPLLKQHYITVGPRSPRAGDVFPEPSYATLAEAMRALNEVLAPQVNR
jgi:hypothetical protein